MRINNLYTPQVPAESTKIDSHRTAEGRGEAGFTAIFEDETKLGAVATALHQSSEQREARVAQLRQQFVDGSYNVDASAVSRKLIDDHIG